jgi:hypothetical protein
MVFFTGFLTGFSVVAPIDDGCDTPGFLGRQFDRDEQ